MNKSYLIIHASHGFATRSVMCLARLTTILRLCWEASSCSHFSSGPSIACAPQLPIYAGLPQQTNALWSPVWSMLLVIVGFDVVLH